MNANIISLMFVLGLILCIVNAVDYLAGWNTISNAVGIVGVTLVVIGILFLNKLKQDEGQASETIK